MKKLKIAFLSPLFESVPPKAYGGTELIVYYLVEGLKKRGYDITLFASGDSKVTVKLAKMSPEALRTDENVSEPQAYINLMMGKFFGKWADNFDIISNHADFNGLTFNCWLKRPMVSTLHGLIVPERKLCYDYYNKGSYFVSISNNQRLNAPNLHYVANIYHGIDLKKYTFNNNPKDYLLWLGRISDQKGPKEAIKIAKRTKQNLIMAGKIDDKFERYFEKKIKPYIDNKQIKFIGEADFKTKLDLLRNAYALVSPLNWQEPFGLVAIEALATGTPVLTTKKGAMPEIIEHGKTGFLGNSYLDLIKYFSQVSKVKRIDCRKACEEKFDKERMIDEYEKVFLKVYNQYNKKCE